MGMLGKGGGIVIGLILVVTGFLLKSGLIEWLLDMMGWILIFVGIITFVVSLVGLVSGGKGRSRGY